MTTKLRLNAREKREYDRCFAIGQAAAIAGVASSMCPFIDGGHSTNVAVDGEVPRYVVTVPYMKAGWLAGFRRGR